MKSILLIALAFGFTANAQIKNWRQVELKSFACKPAHRGKQTFLGAEWTAESNILTAYTKHKNASDDTGTAKDYEITKTYSMSQTLMLIGQPADGSDGYIQVLLRDQKPTTISIDAKGVSYAYCSIEVE